MWRVRVGKTRPGVCGKHTHTHTHTHTRARADRARVGFGVGGMFNCRASVYVQLCELKACSKSYVAFVVVVLELVVYGVLGLSLAIRFL